MLHRYLSIDLPDKVQEISTKLETVIPATLPVTLADIRRVRQLAERYPGRSARELIQRRCDARERPDAYPQYGLSLRPAG
jgi:hypothetical protein